jgi:hypothetical protein
LSDLGNHTYYISRPYRNLNKLPVYRPLAKAEAETEFVIKAALTREETLLAKETPALLEGDERYSDKECELDNLASVNESVTQNKTISNTEFFADAVSCQSLDDDLLYIDRTKRARNR